MNRFRYELQRGGGSMFTCRELSLAERMMYRAKGYKVIKLDPSQMTNIAYRPKNKDDKYCVASEE